MKETLKPLRVRNYRLYFTGQTVSLIGTWMQTVAQSWLVLSLTHSGTLLGAVVAVQLLPVLLFSVYGGLLADRVDKRALLVITNIIQGLLALTLGVLCMTHLVALWMVFGLAFALGLARAFGAPGQQAFASELVGRKLLKNAVTLNNVMNNAARAVGPAAAGVLIASTGVGICFLLNAASFLAVLVSFMRMSPDALKPSVQASREKGQIREGVAYVTRSRQRLGPLLMMAVIGTFAYEFQVSLPVFATGPLHGGASAYGFMTAAMGAGAVVGGLGLNHRLDLGLRSLATLAFGFGVALAATALAPDLASAMALLFVTGAASTAFMSVGASSLQLASRSQYRGRVMALWSMAFNGSTPVGGPIIGAVCAGVSPRAGLAVGALACLACAAAAWWAVRGDTEPEQFRIEDTIPPRNKPAQVIA